MTQPESGRANVPQQPPVPLAPPGTAFPQPPAALLEPDPTSGPGSGPAASWAHKLDPAPRAPRVRAAARDIGWTLALMLAVWCALFVAGVLRAIYTWSNSGIFPLLADWSLLVIPVISAILQTRRIRSGQQTAGKRKMRISIVDARSGRALTTQQAAIRTACVWFCVLSSVGALTLAWDLSRAFSYAAEVGASVGDAYGYSAFFYGLQLFVPSQLGFLAPIVWIGTLISISVGDRRTPWDRAAGTTVVTAQSLWWAENDVPNPRLVAKSASDDAVSAEAVSTQAISNQAIFTQAASTQAVSAQAASTAASDEDAASRNEDAAGSDAS